MKSDIFKIENLLKVIPGLIIFFGFVFNHYFYKTFRIGITSIMTIEELILGFLPVIRPLFLLTLIASVIPIAIMIADENFYSVDYHIDQIKKVDAEVRKSKKLNLKLSLNMLWMLLKTPVVIFFSLYLVVEKTISWSTEDLAKQSFLLYLSNILVLIAIYKALQFLKHYRFRFQYFPINSIITVLTFFVLAKLFADLGVASARDFEPDSKVSFVYDSIEYETNDSLIFLGDTKKFLILRDLRDSSNLFCEREKVSGLKVKELNE